MTKSRWIALLSAIVAAVLLVMLMLPMPIGSGERILAGALLVALILLMLLYVRADRSALENLSDARDELARKLDGMERELADSKAFSQSLLDGVSDPAIIIDKHFNVSSINKAALRRLDGDAAGGEILPCYRALHGRDTPCDPEEHPCVLTTGESCKHLEKRVDADGTERLVELRATPLYDENGDITGAVEVLHDLNEQERLALRLQRAREDAETAHAARAQFVATMSHEVRTPLNAVLGMTDLLRLTSLTRKQKSYVQIMESSSNMLLSLVDNMIDFATIESGRLELRSDSFYVTDLLERVLEIMGYQAYSKGIELAGASDFDPDTQVCGDFHRLQQIMINLVGNAIKFTDAGEVIISVGVETDRSGNTNLTVSVSDTGIGMSQEAAEKLFMPFGSMTHEIGNPNKGSGFGLVISRELVDRMNGRISLESRLGRGTTAWFTVPVTPVTDSDPAIIGGRRVLGKRRLLLVNANPEVSRSIASFLAAWDMSSDTEQRYREVPRRLEAASKSGYPFDCIVLDVDNAATDRLAGARAIREQTDLPIVLLTSIAQPLEVGQVSTIRSTRCVDKPVLPSVLRYNLSRLFEVDLGEPRPVDDDFQSLRILIAEDNPINRKLLKGMLSSLDFDVDAVNDGPAVLTALEESAYDLILTDCQMPGMDGDEVARLIREGNLGKAGQPVVVAVTADVSAQHKQKCLQAGMDDFLAKPVRLDTLKSGLRRWAQMANSRRRQLPDASQLPSTNGADVIARLQDRAGIIDSNALDELISLFIDDTNSRIEVMRHALSENDLNTLRRECHALKGACLELGVTSLGNCCEALGKASRDNRVADLPAEFDRLATEFQRVRPIFEEGRTRPD
jgi:signal transduction histidine kinase/CheY-like chemotaxis protein/HPt (histidine-containing phosphotransfer) domain-containing protein